MTKTIMLGVALVLAVLSAACGSSTPKAAPAAASSAAGPGSQPTAQTDPNGQTCAALDSNGYCPGDPSPSPMVSDPNGQQCAALDSLGYCPGDDPSPMQQWCSGNGYSDYQTVQSDLNQLGTDSGNNDLVSVESDGSSLFHDATVAGQNLPPASKTQKFDYGVYMGYMLVAGAKASTGDITGAASALAKSSQFKNTVFNLTNQCNS